LGQLQRMDTLGQLAGGIAHDFNNVLQVVQGAAAMILQHPHDPDRVLRFASIIAASAERGSAVTGRLLTFARGDETPTELVDPVRLLAGLQEILTHTLGPDIRLHIDAQAGLPALRANRRHLETVLINLAVNGRDAMEGRGLLTLSATIYPVAPVETETVLSELASGPYVCLSVGDTGSGMTPEVLARVTEPFFTTKPQGTGLGLAMAHEFARESGGTLNIDSTLGRGTTVRLWLPVLA
jgi:signal transduction histidine kinase